MCGFAIVILSVLPFDGIPVEVDVVEINHVIELQTGCIRLEQVVFWSWCGACERYEVRDWRLLDKAGWPVLTQAGWLSRWQEDNSRFAVLARVRRETWTGYDVEIEDRRCVPTERRRKIGPIK